MKNKYIFLALILAVLFATCNKNDDNGFESIDLSVKYRHQIKSFKIEKDGNVIILVEKLQKESKLYKVSFNQTEMNNIKNIVNKSALIKCDTLSKHLLSRMGYFMIINNKIDSLTYISGICKQQKLVDNLVLYIEEISSKKKKKVFYNSLESLIPPPPPPLLNTLK